MENNYLITGYWGEPHVTAENDRGINAATFGKGRFVLPVGQQFKAEYIGNNVIRMFDGKLIDNGAIAGIPAGQYIDFSIPNAGQGKERTDYIIFQYKKDGSTLIESGKFIILQGEEYTVGDDPILPELSQQDLLTDEATSDQMALYRVSVSSTEISMPECLYKFVPVRLNRWQYTAKTEADDIEYLNAILDNMGDAENSGDAVAYAVCKREFSIDQTPLHSWLYRIESLNHNFARVEATTSLSNGCKMQRIRINGEWLPWEHIDFPLVLNQEYRTTERFNGKPLFTKLVEEDWTNYKSVQFYDYVDWLRPVFVKGCSSFNNSKCVPFGGCAYDGGHFSVSACGSRDTFGFQVMYDGGSNGGSAGTGYVQVWYYKE